MKAPLGVGAEAQLHRLTVLLQALEKGYRADQAAVPERLHEHRTEAGAAEHTHARRRRQRGAYYGRSANVGQQRHRVAVAPD